MKSDATENSTLFSELGGEGKGAGTGKRKPEPCRGDGAAHSGSVSGKSKPGKSFRYLINFN